MVLLYRRRGGVNGTYRCEIPDALGVIRTIMLKQALVSGACKLYILQSVCCRSSQLVYLIFWPFSGQHPSMTIPCIQLMCSLDLDSNSLTELQMTEQPKSCQ